MARIQKALVRSFTRFIGWLGPERLGRTMLGPRRREFLLGLIFRAMPRAISRRALAKEQIVIGWRITGRADGRSDMRQLVIENGAAELLEGEPRDVDVEISIDAVDFMMVATGHADGPTLFLKERIELDGDLWVAARLQQIFRVPR